MDVKGSYVTILGGGKKNCWLRLVIEMLGLWRKELTLSSVSRTLSVCQTLGMGYDVVFDSILNGMSLDVWM